ncbi:MAG: hypothetical protein BWY54_00736 [Candidatus Dependentiae bacterium ADurb.Bin331]|nr:MAG: hypothetical protein BWY54_00736 [Candidatus Dependentiae bacterium ADurb.Bin331]
MKINTQWHWLLMSLVVSTETQTNGIRDFFYRLRGNSKHSETKISASKTLKIIALESRERNKLFWLNAIQNRDLALNQELAELSGEKTGQTAAPLRTKNEILAETLNNLQLCDDFFPEEHKQIETDIEKQINELRSSIYSKKDSLIRELMKHKSKTPALVFTNYSTRFLPSQEFIQELEWHKRQTELAQKKK